MALDLPPETPVDRSRAGLLRIASPMLGHLLRLPAGQEVVGARIGSWGDVELLIEGAEMPPRDESPAPVTLMCRSEFRDGECGRERRTVVNWEHAPTHQWVLLDWSPAP
jgi:hypothetical protein